MDFSVARLNMVQQQIRACGVSDPNLLNLLTLCPRENFVPNNYQNVAFADTSIPLGNNEYMLPPIIVGKLLSALNIKKHERILEIGTGSGYVTVLLAQLGRSVTSIEINKNFALQAMHKVDSLGLRNVEIIQGDALKCLKGKKNFDVVILTGSVSILPESITRQVKVRGRVFAIVGSPPVMKACVYHRINDHEWSRKSFFETCITPLREIEHATTFEF